MFAGIADFIKFILELPEFLEEIRSLLYLVRDLLTIFIVLLGLQFISLSIFIMMWFNANLYNHEGKFDIKLVLHKHKQADDQKKREQDIQAVLRNLDNYKKPKAVEKKEPVKQSASKKKASTVETKVNKEKKK